MKMCFMTWFKKKKTITTTRRLVYVNCICINMQTRVYYSIHRLGLGSGKLKNFEIPIDATISLFCFYILAPSWSSDPVRMNPAFGQLGLAKF